MLPSINSRERTFGQLIDCPYGRCPVLIHSVEAWGMGVCHMAFGSQGLRERLVRLKLGMTAN